MRKNEKERNDNRRKEKDSLHVKREYKARKNE